MRGRNKRLVENRIRYYMPIFDEEKSYEKIQMLKEMHVEVEIIDVLKDDYINFYENVYKIIRDTLNYKVINEINEAAATKFMNSK